MYRTVLIIDDEPDIREVARASLELTRGWTVYLAESGRSGIEAAQRLAPDLILLDVMMPEMDGPGVFAALRESADTRSIPVVLMTAKVQPAERHHFESLGVDGLVTKPFDPMRLADEIVEMLGGWPGAEKENAA